MRRSCLLGSDNFFSEVVTHASLVVNLMIMVFIFPVFSAASKMDTNVLFEKFTVEEIRDIEKKTRSVYNTIKIFFDRWLPHTAFFWYNTLNRE